MCDRAVNIYLSFLKLFFDWFVENMMFKDFDNAVMFNDHIVFLMQTLMLHF